MSTPNFKTMDNFDLYVIYTSEFEEQYEYKFVLSDFNYSKKSICKDNIIHTNIKLIDGYYSGIQMFVEEIQNPELLDNEDCHYYFNMCRSQAIKQYYSEIRRINKEMKKLVFENGFIKLNCVGIFSNGEAIYSYPDRIKAA